MRETSELQYWTPRMNTSTMTDPGSDSIEALNKKPAKSPPWILFGLLLGVVAFVLVAFSVYVGSAAFLAVMLLITVCSLGVGAFLGFLFGIPKAGGGGDKYYIPNTNLEQVSDWLTKIIIGVGLAECRAIQDSFAVMGQFVEVSLGHDISVSNFISQTLGVLGLVSGFLVAHLWTRLYYGPLQTITDVDLIYSLQLELRSVQSNISAQAKETSKIKDVQTAIATGQLVSQLTPYQPKNESLEGLILNDVHSDDEYFVEAIRPQLEKFIDAEEDWEEDSLRDIFPEATRSDGGYRLDAEVNLESKTGLYITLLVQRLDQKPIPGNVTFLLHPTFASRIEKVVPKDDRAKLQILAGGAFTTVALIEGGKSVLAYDLATLPDAPHWFTVS